MQALGEPEYVVSPSTPLVSTDIHENGWVCGEFVQHRGRSCYTLNELDKSKA